MLDLRQSGMPGARETRNQAEEVESVEEYKGCIEEYTERINSIGLQENVIFSECRTLVNALIQALPLILIDEE